MLITFSGLDGAGKSTLIAWLRSALEGSGHGVTVLHMNDDVGVYAYLRRARDLLTRSRAPAAARSPSTKVPRGRLRQAIVWNRTLRWCLYPLDLLIFAVHRIYVEKVTKRVLLMDRYFFDTLVDLSRGSQRGNGLLQALTPVPDLAVWVDVPPEQAVARKHEYPLEYLRARWSAYKAVFNHVPRYVRVANIEVESARRLLWHVVLARMPGLLGQRSHSIAGLDRMGGV